MTNSEHYVENGRKGGLARSKKYWDKIKHAMTLFVKFPDMTQAEIAKQANVSQAFVSKHTNYSELKIARLSAQKNPIKEEEFEILLEKIKFEIEIEYGSKKRKITKI
jgi:hypothetical protein